MKERFSVWGHFYEKKIAGHSEKLRSRLEIFPLDWEPSRAIFGNPDLIVVMMNPGKSEPLASLENIDGFVPANPDRTQNQIMKLMLDSDGQILHARIINLSDLREKDSAIFRKKLQLYAADESHSIFDSSRKVELKKCFAACGVILFAWGLHPAYHPFAKRVLIASKGKRTLGLTDDGLGYRHPLPRNAAALKHWFESATTQFKNLLLNSPSP